jgi:hypothetical protein
LKKKIDARRRFISEWWKQTLVSLFWEGALRHRASGLEKGMRHAASDEREPWDTLSKQRGLRKHDGVPPIFTAQPLTIWLGSSPIKMDFRRHVLVCFQNWFQEAA